MSTTGNTTQRGYGWRHMQQRKRLMHNHRDGAPCPLCGQPMFKDKTKNWDGHPLEADHGTTRQKDAANKLTNLATRLLHKTCNARDGAHARHGTTPRHQPTPKPAHKPLTSTFTWA